MKKIITWISMILLIISLVGCGGKGKLEKKAGESIAEKILEKAGVDADIDGDKMVIKGEDGQKIIIGEGEWGTSDLAKKVAKCDRGKIVSVLEAKDSVFIMIEEISDEEFKAYLQEIKKDFTNETYELNTDNGMLYSAENDEGIGIMLTYEKDVGFSIAISQVDEETD